MPRPPRLLLSHSYYHIMARGNNKNVIFRSNADYLYFLEQIDRFKKDLPFDLYHYCLMPTHIHFLIRTFSGHNFSDFMKRISLAYFSYYKRKYGWVGHFWQGRFKSQPVGKDEYFIQCGKYIESNPVRSNLVLRPEDYLYSSYRHYVTGIKSPILTEDSLYEDLAKSPEERMIVYKKLVISDIVKDTFYKRIWGSKSEAHNEDEKQRYHLRTS